VATLALLHGRITASGRPPGVAESVLLLLPAGPIPLAARGLTAVLARLGLRALVVTTAKAHRLDPPPANTNDRKTNRRNSPAA
jgi:hypothetical protein